MFIPWHKRPDKSVGTGPTPSEPSQSQGAVMDAPPSDSNSAAGAPCESTPSAGDSSLPEAEEVGAPSEFRVYFVCTGKVCRSVLAAEYLNAATAEIPVRANSGGTEINPEVGVPQDILDAASARGIDLSGHRPQAVTVEAITEADLVLTATVEQRSAVLASVPRALKKTFTLKEFARLAETAEWQPVDSTGATVNLSHECSSFVAEASSRRSQVGRDANAEVDIVDPYLREPAVYREVAEEIVVAIDHILRKMFR